MGSSSVQVVSGGRDGPMIVRGGGLAGPTNVLALCVAFLVGVYVDVDSGDADAAGGADMTMPSPTLCPTKVRQVSDGYPTPKWQHYPPT